MVKIQLEVAVGDLSALQTFLESLTPTNAEPTTENTTQVCVTKEEVDTSAARAMTTAKAKLEKLAAAEKAAAEIKEQTDAEKYAASSKLSRNAEKPTQKTEKQLVAEMDAALDEKGVQHESITGSTTPKHSIEDVRTKLSEKVDKHREALRAKFKEYGYTSVTLLPEEFYNDFMEFMDTLD